MTIVVIVIIIIIAAKKKDRLLGLVIVHRHLHIEIVHHVIVYYAILPSLLSLM